MSIHHLLLIFHLIAATIWVGGHLLLSLMILPKALKYKAPEMILSFEKQYARIGMPALIVLIITGIAMAYDFGIPVQQWFSFSENVESVVSAKLLLLLFTFIVAIHAQTAVIPKLDQSKMTLMAVHIITITVIGVLLLVLGSTVRYGGIHF